MRDILLLRISGSGSQIGVIRTIRTMIRLKDFITTVLVDIEKGVNDAARQTNRYTFLKNMSNTGDEGVEFDVAVTANTEAAGKIGAEVLSLGAKAEGKLSHEEVSRIKFKVNMGHYLTKK